MAYDKYDIDVRDAGYIMKDIYDDRGKLVAKRGDIAVLDRNGSESGVIATVIETERTLIVGEDEARYIVELIANDEDFMYAYGSVRERYEWTNLRTGKDVVDVMKAVFEEYESEIASKEASKNVVYRTPMGNVFDVIECAKKAVKGIKY